MLSWLGFVLYVFSGWHRLGCAVRGREDSYEGKVSIVKEVGGA